MSTIITRNSANSGSVPSLLVQGELAINVTDNRLFFGSGSGNDVKEFGVTASYALSSSYAETASYAPDYLPLTGGTINGDVIVNGTASIAFLNVTYESASVIYSSGSNQFGDALNDTQTLWGTVDIKTGPVLVTGSLNVSGGITGSLLGTASYADYATSASYAATASSADNFIVRNSLTASGLNYPSADNGEFSFIQTDGNGNLSLQYVNTLYETIVNGELTTLTKGTPVYVSGSQGANSIVYRADASNPLKMPVIYISADNIAAGDAGRGIVLGLITGVNTTGYPGGTEIYVAVGGGWTSSRPTGSAIVQVLGVVTKEGNGGQGVVLNPGPANLPNLPSGSIWVGNNDSIPSAVLTSSLSVASAISSSYALSASYAPVTPTFPYTGSAIISGSLTVTGSITQNASTASFGGLVGIGTTTPATTLDVNGSLRTLGVSQLRGPANSTLGSNLQTTSAALIFNNTFNGALGIGSYSNSGAEIQSAQNGGVSVGGSLILQRQAGNTLIGTATDAGFKLDVNGTVRSQGTLTVGTSALTVSSISAGSTQGLGLNSTYFISFSPGSEMARFAANVFGLNSFINNNIAFGYNPTGGSPASAKIEIGAGTATAGTAPLKLRSGVNLTTPENGAFEYDGSNLYFTLNSNRTRILNSSGSQSINGSLTVTGSITQNASTASFGGLVGIGTTTPANTLDVYGTITGASVDTIIRANGGADYVGIGINATKSGGTGQANFFFQKNGTNVWQFGSDFAANGTKDFFIYDSTVGRNPFYVSSGGEVRIGSAAAGGTGGYWNTSPLNIKTSGNVQIGSTTDAGFKLDVNGTARVSGTINVTQVSGNVFRLTNNTYFHSTAGGVQTIDYYNGFVFQNAGQVNIKASFAGNIRFLRESIFGTDGVNNASAQVQIDSTTKGFLPSRTNLTSNISSPAQGLMTYITASATEGLYYYNSGSNIGWHKVLSSTGSQSINGSLTATSFTGSLLGTASYATQALSASYAPSTPAFPYTGSAEITGSLGVTGSFSVQTYNGISNITAMSFTDVTRLINDVQGNQSINADDRDLYDSANINSISWESRRLLDSAAVGSIRWDLRSAYDTVDSQSIAWDARLLKIDNGPASYTVNWGSGILRDTGAKNSVDWENRQLKDSNGNENLNWSSGVSITGSLTVSGSSTFTNIGPAQFSGSFVVQGDLIPGSPPFIPDIGPYDAIKVDDITGQRLLYGSPFQGASASIDFGNRDLLDGTGNGVFNWNGIASSIDSRLYLNETIGATTRDSLVTNIGYGGFALNEVTFDLGVQNFDLVFLDTDGIWYPVDQSTDSSTKMLGICNGYDPGTGLGTVILEGDIVISTGPGYPQVAGAGYGLPVYIRDSTGNIMSTTIPTAGYVRLLGHCYHNPGGGTEWIMKFRPSHEWIEL